MKSQRFFPFFVLLTLLFSPFGNNRQVRAGISSVDKLNAGIVDRDLILWGADQTGYVNSSTYDNWRFTLTEVHHFTVTVTSVVGDLIPLLILLDASRNELTRGIGTLTSAQPAGNYSIQVQPQTGEGYYFLTTQDVIQNQPTASITVSPSSINIGGTATVTVSLDNVPAEGYTGVELTCTYYPDLVEAGNIVIANLFGPDPATAINGPQNDRFIVAIAGSDGYKATNSGTVLAFNVRGLRAGQSPMECQARVSMGNNALTRIASTGNNVIVLENTPTPGTEPAFCDKAEFIADITVPPGTEMAPGVQFIKTWRLKNAGTCVWTTSYQLVFFSGEQMGAPSSVSFPVNVSPGQVVDLSLNMTAPSVPGSYRGYWMFRNASGALFGAGAQADEPWFADIVVSGATVTPGPTITQSPTPLTPTATPGEPPAPTSTSTPVGSPIPTSTPGTTGVLTGQVLASRIVTINVYDTGNTVVGSGTVNVDGTFALNVTSGTNSVIATASGFLSAQGYVTITDGNISTLPTITLIAGDIDNNNVIDQFDALTIGMSYNTAVPAAADLNNDGIINVLDLELLASNYRKTGPIVWQ